MKPITIPRPTDPELRRQWDEAKRACEARTTPEGLRQTMLDAIRYAKECEAAGVEPHSKVDAAVAAALSDPSCCVGDRSQCRCAPERGGWSDEDVEREKWMQVWNEDEESP